MTYCKTGCIRRPRWWHTWRNRNGAAGTDKKSLNKWSVKCRNRNYRQIKRLYRRQVLCLPWILLKLLTMSTWTEIIWRMRYHCTTKYLCINLSVTRTKTCLGIFPKYNSTALWKHEVCNEGVHRRLYLTHQNGREIVQKSGAVLEHMWQAQPVSLSKEVRSLHQKRKIVRSHYRQQRIKVGSREYGSD